ncbi:hypothetical protein SESBI_50554 [Sesbania bispinosa]|nr:hypothetical protein SESBI_50554 [Sesbania bispinosa]
MGKRKMVESSIEDKKDDTRSYFTWNLEMERVLADVMRDQRNLGRKGDGNWKAVAYNTAAHVLSNRFKVQLIGDNLHEEARRFRFKVIPNWDDIVDLCAKDRATGTGAENTLDDDDIMSKETNEGEDSHCVNIDSEEPNSSTKKGFTQARVEIKKG